MLQSPLLGLLFGQNNPAANNIMMMAQSAGLIDLAAQGYQAYRSGRLPDFVAYQYDHNPAFRDFYARHKDQTLDEFLSGHNINLDDTSGKPDMLNK